MSTTPRFTLKNLRRPFREVELPGGVAAVVRDLSVAELLAVDSRAEERPEGTAREVRRGLLLAVYALAMTDGTPAFPDATEADLAEAEQLTPGQIQAIAAAAIPTKADAKN